MNKTRYNRQIILSEFGLEGQQKLLDSHVLIVGCGGLGSIVAPYLAGAGIGRLTLVDGDQPSISNLHRQIIFGIDQLDLTKSLALKNHIKKLNPDVEVNAIESMLTKANLDSCFEEIDLVVDCTDSMMTKYLINDACHLKNIPLVYGSIYKYEGYVSVFKNMSRDDIHLRDVFPEIDTNVPSCSEIGVMGTIAGIIGLIQANEVVKYIGDLGESLVGKMLTYNILDYSQYKIELKKSWQKDIHSIFQNESYHDEICGADLNISYEEIKRNRSHYLLCSILEADEHQHIIDADIHLPLSIFSIDKVKADHKTLVCFCKSGQRSGRLVTQLKQEFPELEVLSLAGGWASLD